MDEAQAKLESLKMVKEWSTWLIALQTAICAFLWNVLKTLEIKSWLDVFLYFGWFAFSLSLLIATVLVSRLPYRIESLPESSPDRSVLSEPVAILGGKVRLKTFVMAEHVCFIVGVLCLVTHIARQLILKNMKL